jgi:hypothetical protein
MDEKRPPDLDAEYKVVHGPWPRWALQLSLLKLALRSVAVVVFCIGVAVLVAWLLRPR